MSVHPFLTRACRLASLTLSSLLAGNAAWAQGIPAFPGAEGSGAGATGGRGGDVYFVTSLADTNTAGTLRFGLGNAPAAGRTIIFRTSGTITLGSDINITKSKITIAGQTAPGQGITLAQRRLRVTNTNNVVLRNIRARVGNFVTLNSDPTYQPDAIWVSGSSNVVLDHVSAGWSVDEVLSVTDSSNVSVQWSSISEALNNAGHSSGAHSYGSLISGDRISYHHNLYAHNNSRNPRPQVLNAGTTNLDFRNNVLFNWGDQAGYNGDEAGILNMNYVGNYFVAGPTTPSSKVSRAFLFGLTTANVHQSGNRIDSNKNLVRDGTDTGTAMFSGTPSTWSPTPVGNPGYVSPQTADAAYTSVMAFAGAHHWNRDAVDTRVFGNVATMTGSIIDSPSQVGGYPTLTTGTAPLDTDNDGMPDSWELSRSLSPTVANNNADFDTDGYTDLEEYLNELAAWPASAPAVWTAPSGRFALWSNWDTRWQPSRFDTAQINSGTAIIDSVGQEAGRVEVGPAATLTISSGWLRVSGDVAASPGGTVSMTGGKLIVAGTISGAGVSLSGGTLAASTVSATAMPNGTFRQLAGLTVAPGDTASAGRMTITGAYAAEGGTLALDLGGPTPATTFQSVAPAFDNLAVTGNLTLSGGTLALSLIGGYDPALGSAHTIATAASLAGRFATVTGHQLAFGKWLAVTYTPVSIIATAALPGDLDLSGAVNFSDLFEVARAFGTTSGASWSTGDFTGDGRVDAADQAVLARFYLPNPGQTFDGDWANARRIVAVVPEPGPLLASGGAVMLISRRRRRR